VLGDDLSPRLPLHVESGLFRIAQEALTNVSKHAQAKRVAVAVKHDASRVRLEVADDGIGFEETPPSLQDGRRGWGIVTMAERAESVGGTCQVASIPGQGTRVIVEVAR
jgi:signal transduction histidine kinase